MSLLFSITAPWMFKFLTILRQKQTGQNTALLSKSFKHNNLHIKNFTTDFCTLVCKISLTWKKKEGNEEQRVKISWDCPFLGQCHEIFHSCFHDFNSNGIVFHMYFRIWSRICRDIHVCHRHRQVKLRSFSHSSISHF